MCPAPDPTPAPEPSRSRSGLRYVVVGCGAALAVIGILTLHAGWTDDVTSSFAAGGRAASLAAGLVRVVNGFALCLIALDFRRSALGCACAAGAMCAAVLAESALGLDLGLARLTAFVGTDPLPIGGTLGGRLPPNGALGCLLASIAILCLCGRAWTAARETVSGASATAVAVFGAAMVVAHGYGITAAYEWAKGSPIPIAGAIGTVLVGAGAIAYVVGERDERRPGPDWLATVALLGGSAAALLLGAAAATVEDEAAARLVKADARGFARHVAEDLDERFHALRRLSGRCSAIGDDGNAEWSAECAGFLRDYEELTAIVWQRSGAGDVWAWPEPMKAILPVLAEECGSGAPLAEFDAAWFSDRAGPAQALVISRPVVQKDGSRGRLFCVIDPARLIARIDRLRGTVSSYSVRAVAGDRELRQPTSSTPHGAGPGSESAVVDDPPVGWTITLTPRSPVSEGRLPQAVVLTGIGMSVLLASALHQARRARVHTAEAQETGRRLSAEVAERERAVAAHRESAAMFEGLFEGVPDGLIVVEEGGAITRVNARVEDMFRASRGELLGKPVEILVSEAFRGGHVAQRDAYLANAAARSMAAGRMLRGRRLDGTEFPVDIELSPLRRAGRMLVVAAVRDVTERQAVEAALRRSEERYRRFFDADLAGVFVSTPDGQLIDCNGAFLRMFGFANADEARATRTDELYVDAGERAELLDDVRRNRGTATRELHLRRRDSTIMVAMLNVAGVFDEGGRLSEMTGYLSDVTQERRLEEQLRQSQRLEALGRLAGGVAHDFNNLLTVIAGYSELLLSRTAEGDPSRRELAEIRDASDRATEVTRQLLAFSRGQVLQVQVLDLNAVVRGIEALLRRVIGEDVTLEVILDASLGRVAADSGQIGQVLVNLAINARDAMPRGGKLTIETRNAEFDDAHARAHAGFAAGRYAMVALTDTGCGMDAATLSRIFEPFFTTKEPGRGTGLGLATVHGIVQQSGGHIEVTSEPAHGTRFTVYLPLVDAPLTPEQPEPATVENLGATETVLVAEDDDAIRSFVEAVLESGGYSVVSARDGNDALRVCGERAGPIHVLLTDFVMPSLTGPELASRISESRPETRVLYMSGYTDNTAPGRETLSPDAHFLAKPFTSSVLLSKLREVLEAPRG